MNIERVEEAGSFYDRIARFYDWTFKFNRYRHSIEHYLTANPLPLSPDARVLDAGCGTGLLTLALVNSLRRSTRITAIDLAASSLVTANEAVTKEQSNARAKHAVAFAQANVLKLPFADESFDFVATCGALEYVPIEAGLTELARVTAPGGYLLHLPIRPSPLGKLFESIFRFKMHSPHAIQSATKRHFQILDTYDFPPLDPIGWTKVAILAQKP